MTPDERAREIVAKLRDRDADEATILTAEEAFEIANHLESSLRAPKGHVIDEEGRVVRVLGTLPMTADGCIVGNDGRVFASVRMSDWTMEVQEVRPIYWQDNEVDSSECYSTREAAEAAAKEQSK